jgi:hypothetical protein
MKKLLNLLSEISRNQYFATVLFFSIICALLLVYILHPEQKVDFIYNAF